MGTSPQGWVVLAQAGIEASWAVRAAAGGGEDVGDEVQRFTAVVLGGLKMATTLPGTDCRGRDAHRGGCGFGGDDPLKVLPSQVRRYRVAPIPVASQWTSGLLIPVAGGDGYPKDVACREHQAASVSPDRGKVAAVDPLADRRGRQAPCLRRLSCGELVRTDPVRPALTLVAPVPVIFRFHLPPPVGLQLLRLRPVVAGAVEEDLGCGGVGEQGRGGSGQV